MRITRWAIATCIVCVLVALSLSLPNVGTAAPSAGSPEEPNFNRACVPGTSCEITEDMIPENSSLECHVGICSPQYTCVPQAITTEAPPIPKTRSPIVSLCSAPSQRCQDGYLITAPTSINEGLRCNSIPDDGNECTERGCQNGECYYDRASLRPPDGSYCSGALDSDLCSNPGCRDGQCLANHPLNAAPDGTTCGEPLQSQCKTQVSTCKSGVCGSTTSFFDSSVACNLAGARTGACDPIPRCDGLGNCSQAKPIVCPTPTGRCQENICDKTSPSGCRLRDIIPCPCPTPCGAPKTKQDPTTCQCSCPNTCTAPQVQNSLTCACQCPSPGASACTADQIFDTATCLCKPSGCPNTCTSPKVLDANCNCVCPAPGAAACAPGQTFNTKTCKCECPAGSGKDPSTGQCIACEEIDTPCYIQKIWNDGSCRKISKCQSMKGAFSSFTTGCMGESKKPCPVPTSADGSSPPSTGCMMEYGPEVFTGACDVDEYGTELGCLKECKYGSQQCFGCGGPEVKGCTDFKCTAGNCTPRASCCLGFGDLISPVIGSVNCPIACCSTVCGMDMDDLSCSQ